MSVIQNTKSTICKICHTTGDLIDFDDRTLLIVDFVSIIITVVVHIISFWSSAILHRLKQKHLLHLEFEAT